MSSPSSATAAADAAAPISSPARLVSVFTSPGRTFADIARAPHFVLCIAVQVVVGMSYWGLILHRIGSYNLARQALLQTARGRAMDPAALQSAASLTGKLYSYSLYATPVFGILFALFMGVIFLGVSNLLLGQEARYKQALSMTCHALLTTTLYALVAMLLLVLMPDPTNFQFTNPIGTNPAFFMDKASSSAFVYAFATRLDLFTIWGVILLAIGLAKLGGKKGKVSSAFWATFTLWMLYCLVTSGIAAAFA
ncbi:MAG: YIP1 family protein [Terriglobales bacterium]